MASTLYALPDNFRTQKILIAAQYSGASIKLAEDFVLGQTNKSEEFLKKFPNGKKETHKRVIIKWQTSGQFSIITNPSFKGMFLAVEVCAITEVGNDQLRGSNLLDQSQILQWLSFADSEILPPACTWIFPLLGIIQYNKQNAEKAKEDVKRVLNVLNQHLLTRTYLVGERITLADISVCCNLLSLYQMVLEPSFRTPFGNVNRWFTTLINQPEFKAVLGNVVLCEQMTQFDAKKFAEMQQKQSKDKSAKPKDKKEEKKKEQKPKTPSKKEKEETEEPDETELALAQEPKSKDPFEAFPKGTFVMDNFKKVYSNEDESVSIKWFWDNFDAENYSIWYCEYLYPDELTLVFMSCNLIGGMFQRLDKMRKNAFASMCLFGEDNNSTISGIWVWRGHELAFTLSPDWQVDYESYSWKKLDHTSEETKKLVNEYLAWSGDFGGKKFNQGKIFK